MILAAYKCFFSLIIFALYIIFIDLAGGQEEIKKQCALGPCYLRDSERSTELGVTCDKSQQSYLCVECCQGDKCGFGTTESNTATISPYAAITVSLSLALLMLLYLS